MKEAPEPKWLRFSRNVENYGVEAVFGRKILHEYEMRAMTISKNVVETFRVRSRSKDWVKWNKDNPDSAEMLNWAAEEWHKTNGE